MCSPGVNLKGRPTWGGRRDKKVREPDSVDRCVGSYLGPMRIRGRDLQVGPNALYGLEKGVVLLVCAFVFVSSCVFNVSCMSFV